MSTTCNRPELGKLTTALRKIDFDPITARQYAVALLTPGDESNDIIHKIGARIFQKMRSVALANGTVDYYESEAIREVTDNAAYIESFYPPSE